MSSSQPAIPSASALAPVGAGTLARPELPRSQPLSAAGIRAVDIDERMDPLAVAESTGDEARPLAATAWQFAVITLAGAAIWLLLPTGSKARPPLELPAPLQAEPAPLTAGQRRVEAAAIDLLEQGLPSRALVAFRGCVEGPEGASVNLWRYYLQTLVDLDERAELGQRADEFAARHPDRLEAPHFSCEALCRVATSPPRRFTMPWSRQVSPDHMAAVERCQAAITDGLVLLQQRDGDWPSSGRTAWADLLHLDRARLHHHAWRWKGSSFDDPDRESALEAIRGLSSTVSVDALTLRRDIYRACLEAWPKTFGFEAKRQLINGQQWSKDDLGRAYEADRAAIERLPPVGRR